MSLCLACGSSFAADPKPADAKVAAPAAAAAAPAPATTPAPAAAPTKAVTPAAAEEPAVKKSNTSICHDKSSPSYKQTKNFTEFKQWTNVLRVVDAHQKAVNNYGKLNLPAYRISLWIFAINSRKKSVRLKRLEDFYWILGDW